jgi:Spy/CpxP family protein refolding chaperone
MTNSRARVTLLLAITFFAGLAAGFVTHQQLAGPEVVAESAASGEGSEGQRGTTIERFADELGLTAEQRAEIAPIVAETRREMSELFAPVRPAYAEVVNSARARIEAILTEEQVEEYRVLLEREYGSGEMTD